MVTLAIRNLLCFSVFEVRVSPSYGHEWMIILISIEVAR
jgi:hypothetical protein